VRRPWRCPDWLLGLGAVLSFVNAFLLGAGADVWGRGTLVAGFVSGTSISNMCRANFRVMWEPSSMR
jgi:hypothetical protein